MFLEFFVLYMFYMFVEGYVNIVAASDAIGLVIDCTNPF